ncbi:MAG: DUF2339 domain-containing protein [Lachnospiraceae bacterium]|nr:DUF2339 domain-containing protein [Lachnospiraceae bacterium]
MEQKKIDILNFENDLLNTRKRLNDLIYAYSKENPASENYELYKEKINHLEAELKYMDVQLQRMKQEFYAVNIVPSEVIVNKNVLNESISNESILNESILNKTIQAESIQNKDIPSNVYRNTQDYEKIFGKNFMGIFASVLIFISLIIFATLVLPYLSNTIKMIGLYIVSFAILSAGLILYKKKPENKFYIALIGCGAGSLYITLLLSDLYFKVIGDITLYIFILVWAVFVKYLTKYKNLVFTIIGQSGIFISTILGTALCVREQDIAKFFVLVVFYIISSCVYSNFSKDYLRFILSGNKTDSETAHMQFFYEDNLCSHICKPLNITVFMLGFTAFIKPGGFELTSIFLLMFYLLFEYYFAYKEICRSGIAFELLTIVNSFLLVCLFNVTQVLSEDYSYILMYIISIAVLFYVNRKKTNYTIVSEICCFIMILLGSCGNPFIRNHLYAYITIIPFMIYGKLKDKKQYLYAGIAYTAEFLFIIMSLSSNYFLKIESLIMIFVVYAVFLYVCRNLELPAFKIIGYLILCFITMLCIDDVAHHSMYRYNDTHITHIEYIGIKASLIPFFVIALIHLILNKLEYFGKEASVERMMYIFTAILMIAGCTEMYNEVWKLPVILVTLLLFIVNSKKLLSKNKYAGYYIAFKYTVLMICILTSYNVVDYVVSICLLLFAIVSIIAGFYKDTSSFRLYGLVLSMISIIKLIMIDIHYDNTIENAVSFFVSGVLCFIISFIYHKIDTSFRNKEE